MAYDGFFADISTRSSVNEVLERAEAIKSQVDTLYQGTQVGAGNANQSAIKAKNEADRAQRIADSINGEFPKYGTRQPSPFDPEFGAKGDGVTDDTAAFAAFEVKYKGKTVDLGFAKCSVTAIPRGNSYLNGSWYIPGDPHKFTRTAYEGDLTHSRLGMHHSFGGGLNSLKAALTDPLNQYVGIVFIGDSITWGSGNGSEQAPNAPRNGTLKDPRDYSGTNSYVNQVKRYLVDQYLQGANVTYTGWEGSPWGDSVLTAVKDHITMPLGVEFPTTIVGSNVVITESQSAALPAKWRMNISNGNEVDGQNAYGSVSFRYTGNSFKLYLGCVDASSSDYQIFIDGVSIGRFGTHAGATIDDGELVDNKTGLRTHYFPHCRNALVEIRALRPLLPNTGTRVLRIHGLVIPKTLRIANNGINGSAFGAYRLYNLPPTCWQYSGTSAINPGDQFCFIQLGTNDRGTNRGPQTMHFIMQEARTLLDAIPIYCTPILMVSNPAVHAGANITQGDIRSLLMTLARERAIDFIDNFGVFQGLDIKSYANDLLHPNAYGYSIMAGNIIKSLETSMDTSIIPPEPPLPSFAIKPADPIFLTKVTGGNIIDRVADAAYLGVQRQIRTNPGGVGSIKFQVQGKDWGIAYSALTQSIMNYEVLVDGVSVGIYSTKYLESGGGTSVYRNIRWHTVPNDGQPHIVEIKTVRRPEWPDVIQDLYLEAFLYKEGTSIVEVGGEPEVPEVPEVILRIRPDDPRLVRNAPFGTRFIDRESGGSILGVQLKVQSNPGAQRASISFKAKGKSVGLTFSSLATQIMDYQLYVDGVSKGTFSTTLGAPNGGVSMYGNERFHDIPNDGGTHDIQIFPTRKDVPSEAGLIQVFYLEAIITKEDGEITRGVL